MYCSYFQATRLSKLEYTEIISGNINISPDLGPPFLQAFYSQPNPVDSVANLVTSKAGISALQTAICYDLSPQFFNSHATAVLQYFQDDQLKIVNNGAFLADIIQKLANPPTFWTEFRKAFLQGQLNEAATHSFAWLLLQLFTLPVDKSARYRPGEDAEMPTVLNRLRLSSSPQVVALGTKIENVHNTAHSITYTTNINKHVYQHDFPVKCPRHPGTESCLSNGRCTFPCGAKLTCGHLCPLKCHNFTDHSKMKCMEAQSSECTNRHPQIWTCSAGSPKTCRKCKHIAKLARKKQRKSLADKLRRNAEQKAHLERIDAIDRDAEPVRGEVGSAVGRGISRNQPEDDLESVRAADWDVTMFDHTTALPTSPFKFSFPYLTGPTTVPTPLNDSPSPSPPSSPIPTKMPFFGKIPGSGSGAIQSQAVVQNPVVPQKSQAPEKLFPPLKPSPSEQEWRRLKDKEDMDCDAIDAIMDMKGLEAVKEQVLKAKAKIDTSRRQGVSLIRECFNSVFLGNPGTGKTTIARHYAQFLAEVGATRNNNFTETTGAQLAQGGVDEAKQLIRDAVRSGGGTVFVDEAYQLTNGNNHSGPAVLDLLLAEMEKSRGILVFIFAGYNKEMEKFFEHNPGLKSRVPYQFAFTDYKNEELMAIFKAMVKKTYSGRMNFEGGIEGLYTRIAIRRLGRRRGRPGFGNVRDLEQMFSQIRERQAARLTKARKEGSKADDFFMSREDLIGPDPSTAILESESWKKLQTLIGLKSVKESVQSFFSLVEENYQRELQEKEPIEMSLNRVFLGSPGTGKTSVAKLYGQILADLGLLTNGEVVTKNPADFQGAVLGASEANTKAILTSTVGKVLIIDEAYMLYGGGSKDNGTNAGSSNQYKTSIIDTIVAEVQNLPGDDRCVLLLGYKDQMVEMFQNVNPGLSRRFKIEDAFNFDDFSDKELLRILDLKLEACELDATDSAKKVALEHLIRMRNRPNFGNAGEVENIITQAKARCVSRRATLPAADRPIDIVFEPQDFDPDFDRGVTATANLVKLFDDIVGCEDIIDELKGYQELALVCKETDKDPRELIPMNFVFTGPPGTGKTTVARKIGQVYYDMGILGSAEVIECSASDLVGQYTGQTGPKTKKLFEKALGKVLFIDEAYRLSEGNFAQEAIDELVGLLTHPSFKSKLIIILAGYEHDINRLLSINAGLSSRFPDQIVFRNMDADRCMIILRKELAKNQVTIDNLDDPTSMVYVGIREVITDMSELKDWSNARDMITLSKALASRALLSLKDLPAGADACLSADEALDITKKMLHDRQRRANVPAMPRRIIRLPEQSAILRPPTPPLVSTTTSTVVTPPTSPRMQTPTSPKQKQSTRNQSQPAAVNCGRRGTGPSTQGAKSPLAIPTQPSVQRDPGVSDEVWQELDEAKRAADAIVAKAMKEQREFESKVAEQKRFEEVQHKKKLEVERALATEEDPARRAELQRQRDEAHRLEGAAQAGKQKATDRLHALQESERLSEKEEQRIQQKLREMGVCDAGYRWQNMGSYYICEGGTHTVAASKLGL